MRIQDGVQIAYSRWTREMKMKDERYAKGRSMYLIVRRANTDAKLRKVPVATVPPCDAGLMIVRGGALMGEGAPSSM